MFETPLALLALAAVGVPVVAHLLRRRDLRTVELPTIALLSRAQAASRRRVRLVDRLLLLCRVLCVAALALALAGPFTARHVAFGDGRPASVAIVVDDSMSMSRRGADSETLLEEAARRAARAAAALPSGSEITLVLAGAPARVVVRRASDAEPVLAALDGLPPTSARGTDLAGAVRSATRELGSGTLPRRRLLVLSDFARHGRLDEAPSPSPDVEATWIRVGPEEGEDNRFVGAALAIPDPTTPGRASVRVSVRELGASAGPRTVRLRRGSTELAEARVELTEGIGRSTLHADLPADGDPSAEVAIDGADALPEDDRRGVLLRAPTALRVLLVDGDPHASRHQDEVAFLARALERAPRRDGVIGWRTVDPDTVSTGTLTDVDVVVLANVPSASRVLVDRLRTFVDQGGGLLVSPGDRVDARVLASTLGPLLPARPRPATAQEEQIGLASPPGLEPAWDTAGLSLVRTWRRLLLEAESTAEVVLTFPDGHPALLLGRHGDGRTALLATTIDDDWTDLPYRPGFLPLLVQVVHRLAPGGRVPERDISPGEAVTLSAPPGADRLRVLTPTGRAIDLASAPTPIELRNTEEAGVYRVQVAAAGEPLRDDPRAAFLVAPPAAESDLSTDPLPAGADGDAEDAAGSLVRVPLAPWLFLFAGLLLLAEGGLRLARRG